MDDLVFLEAGIPMINGKWIAVAVDYFDMCYFASASGQGLYDEDRIRRLMAMCKAHGADTVLWRVSACGQVIYPSRVENRFGSAGDPRKHTAAVVEAMARFDPLEVAARAAREQGLEFLVWVTLYDDYFVWSESRLIQEQPHVQMVDRLGKLYFRGVVSYAYPEAVDFRLRQFREILDYDVDGLHMSCRSHANQSCPFRMPDMFGFNKPIADEYQRRTGDDLCKVTNIEIKTNAMHVADWMAFPDDPFDRELWHAIKGEYHTQFLRSVRREFPDKKLSLCFPITPGMPDAPLWEGVHPMGQFKLDISTWINEKLVDTLTPSEYGARWDLIHTWAEHYAPTAQAAGVKMATYQWIRNVGFNAMAQTVADRTAAGFDGTVFHEAACLEWPDTNANAQSTEDESKQQEREQVIAATKEQFFKPVWQIG